MQFADRVKRSGRLLLWIHQWEDAREVPQIGLVAEIAGTCRFFKSSMLFLAEDQDRAVLVPDSFIMGACHFGKNFRLQHIGQAPAPSSEADDVDLLRACSLPLSIQIE